MRLEGPRYCTPLRNCWERDLTIEYAEYGYTVMELLEIDMSIKDMNKTYKLPRVWNRWPIQAKKTLKF